MKSKSAHSQSYRLIAILLLEMYQCLIKITWDLSHSKTLKCIGTQQMTKVTNISAEICFIGW